MKLQKYNGEYNKLCEDNGLKKLSERITVQKWNRSEASKAAQTAVKIEKFKSAICSAEKTSTGIIIKDVSTHCFTRSNYRGISADDIASALTKPLGLGKIRNDNSQQFYGEPATVVFNIETGRVVTCWRTGKGKIEKLKGEK